MSHSPTASATPGSAIPRMMDGAVQNVFRTMAQRQVQLQRQWDRGRPPVPMHELAPHHDHLVVATVGFTGRANGAVCLYLSRGLATELTGAILGLDAQGSQIDFDMVKDAMVELTNVTAGSFKSHLCQHGYGCHLTIPSILQAPHAAFEDVPDTSRWTMEFETSGSRFMVDVLCDQAL